MTKNKNISKTNLVKIQKNYRELYDKLEQEKDNLMLDISKKHNNRNVKLNSILRILKSF